MRELSCRRGKDGETRFFLGETDITYEWMDFFSTLSPEKERECVKWFKKRAIYKKLTQKEG